MVLPPVAIRSILPLTDSVNHNAPSGPVVIPPALLFSVGSVNSVTAPVVVIRPILPRKCVNHTADPLLGAVLMGTFGLARGIPIVAAATMAVLLVNLQSTGRFTLWAERIGAALMLATALYFLYEAALYAGWLSP